MCSLFSPAVDDFRSRTRAVLKGALLAAASSMVLHGAALANGPLAAGPQEIAQSQAMMSFDILAGNLGDALDQFAVQSGYQVIHQEDLTGLSGPAVAGRLTAPEALRLLLAGSGLIAEKLDPGTFTLRSNKTGQADGGEIYLQEILVSATRTEQSAETVPTNVVVIDREEIEQQIAINSHPGKLLEKYVPGFGVSTGMMSGSGENFRGRGIQVLVDGLSRNIPLRNVTRTISVIDLNQIERIEIVPGSNATYGNGATGGTVNFITRNTGASGFKHQVDTSLKFFTASPEDSLAPKVTLSSRGGRGEWDYSVVGSVERTQDRYDGAGDQIASDAMIGQGNLDNTLSLDLLAKIGYQLDDEQRLDVSHTSIRRRQDPDYFTDYSTDPISVDEDNPYTGKDITEESDHSNIKYEFADTKIGNLSVTVYRDDINKRFAFSEISTANPLVLSTGSGSTTQDPDGQSELHAERYGLRSTVDTDFGQYMEGLEATWGLDFSYEDVAQQFQNGIDRIAPMQQFNYAPFVQLNAPVSDRLRLRGGVRYERYDLDIEDFRRADIAFLSSGTVFAVPGRNVSGGDFSYDEVVYNAGAVLDVDEESELFANYSQGFSLPDIGSFTARAGITSPFSTSDIDFSDLNIKAAVVDSYEIGYRTRNSQFRFEAGAFLSTSDFGTTLDTDTEALTQARERIYGFELNGEWFYDEETSYGAVVGYTEGKWDSDEDGDIDYYLPNSRIGAPLRTTLYVDKAVMEDMLVRGEVVYSGSRSKYDGSETYKLPSTVTFNLAMQVPFWDGMFNAGVENLLDRDQLNPAASASRNTPVAGLGRIITIGYSRKF